MCGKTVVAELQTEKAYLIKKFKKTSKIHKE